MTIERAPATRNVRKEPIMTPARFGMQQQKYLPPMKNSLVPRAMRLDLSAAVGIADSRRKARLWPAAQVEGPVKGLYSQATARQWYGNWKDYHQLDMPECFFCPGQCACDAMQLNALLHSPLESEGQSTQERDSANKRFATPTKALIL